MAFDFKNCLTPPTPLFSHENDQREKYKQQQNKTVPASKRTGENAMNRTEYLRDLGSTAGARAGEAVLHLGPIER